MDPLRESQDEPVPAQDEVATDAAEEQDSAGSGAAAEEEDDQADA